MRCHPVRPQQAPDLAISPYNRFGPFRKNRPRCRLFVVSGAIKHHLNTIEVTVSPLAGLPVRQGSRPRMTEALPHIQLDQWPPPDMVGELLARAARLPDVMVRQSRMAALEWCRARPGGTSAPGVPLDALHKTCPNSAICIASAGRPRPPYDAARGQNRESRTGLGGSSPGSPNRIGIALSGWWSMPRDQLELAAALTIVEISWAFARGQSLLPGPIEARRSVQPASTGGSTSAPIGPPRPRGSTGRPDRRYNAGAPRPVDRVGRRHGDDRIFVRSRQHLPPRRPGRQSSGNGVAALSKWRRGSSRQAGRGLGAWSDLGTPASAGSCWRATTRETCPAV